MEEYSLLWYLKQAQSIIAKFGSKHLLYDDENIATVAHYMMVADNTYDASRGAKRSTWRVTRAKYALLNIYRKQKSVIKTVSLSTITPDGRELGDLVEDSHEEQKTIDISSLLSTDFLTEREASVLRKKYIDNLTLGKIAEEYKISRQAVHETIKRAVKKIKNKKKLLEDIKESYE